MEIDKTTANAQALIDALGDGAEAEAEQKIKELEAAGNNDEAQDWRAIRNAVRKLRATPKS